MSKFHTICYGMFPTCHISNKMQKHLFNAKYDCPDEDAGMFSLLLVGDTELITLPVLITGYIFLFEPGFTKKSADK